MFVSESNNPLENDEIRTLKRTFQKREITSCLFQPLIIGFIAI
jgi:hypothetical protein